MGGIQTEFKMVRITEPTAVASLKMKFIGDGVDT